ncbi:MULTISPECIES: signal peptidase I [Streptomyces]|uniref:signal peptidase I n=1 Tax=Streptomyces TaxID=1883 RepID=UPI001317EA0B|nr:MULTISPECIES: signal peptidase I [Streptomyces]QGZ53119.1 signal peptidase I [Streptomyces sp. QHH-9511]
MAVGARSGHDEPEERPEQLAESSVAMRDDSAGRQDADAADAEGEPGQSDQGAKKPRSFWKELPLLIGIALLLALLIKTFLVQAFSIPSDSMMNTLQRGDRVLVDKLTPWFGSEPERGEVVVFHDPGGWLEGEPVPEQNLVQEFLSFIGLMPSAEDKDLIKRVIAVGGDTVSCKEGGKVVLNGKPLDETAYIYPGSTPCGDKPFGPITVPEGSIWVMGDNRQNSLDSRYHQNLSGGGTVSNEKVVGRAIVVAWPVTRWATLPVPDVFDQPGLSQALTVAPGAAGLAGALPLVLWRRKRHTSRHTAR